jgi:hypothetical protein
MRSAQPTEWIACITGGCQEDDPNVLVSCRDGEIRCAHHANIAGMCWDCGDGDPTFMLSDPEEETNGMCHDCRSAYYAEGHTRARS